jgi:hypothetical protein
MTTDRKIKANQRNAERSTGPKTTEGKRRSRRNAVSHGLTAAISNPTDQALIDELIARLVNDNPSSEHDDAHAAAQSQLKLARIRLSRSQSLRILASLIGQDLPSAGRVLGHLTRIDDYERKARSLRRKAFARIWAPNPET